MQDKDNLQKRKNRFDNNKCLKLNQFEHFNSFPSFYLRTQEEKLLDVKGFIRAAEGKSIVFNFIFFSLLLIDFWIAESNVCSSNTPKTNEPLSFEHITP